jgi:hypothetical protein
VNEYICIDGPLDGDPVADCGPKMQCGPHIYRRDSVAKVYRYEGLLLTSPFLDGDEANALAWNPTPMLTNAQHEIPEPISPTASVAPTASDSLTDLHQQLVVIHQRLTQIHTGMDNCNPLPALRQSIELHRGQLAVAKKIQQLRPGAIVDKLLVHYSDMLAATEWVTINLAEARHPETQEAVDLALAQIEASKPSKELWQQFFEYIDYAPTALPRPAPAPKAPSAQTPPTRVPARPTTHSDAPWLDGAGYLLFFAVQGLIFTCIWGPVLGLLVLPVAIGIYFCVAEKDDKQN